ncbi:pyridoxal phosphate-dependent transferase [Blastocladiella britannica]|nr:pyridoxal phosphate-dependent transferase [Blastocladiella britannica]
MVLPVPQPQRQGAVPRLTQLAREPKSYPALVLPNNVQDATDELVKAAAAVPAARYRDLFQLRPDVSFLNQGSFGTIPIAVRKVKDAWMDAVEQEPVDALTEFDPYIAAAQRDISEFVGADPQDVVFVSCATTGTNTALQSLHLGPKDTILVISLAYPAVLNNLQYLRDRYGVRIEVLNVPLPTSRHAIIDAFAEWFRTATVTPKVAVLDHITSATALVLPVNEIVAMCRERGVLSLIDGAHAVGQVPINLRDMDPDFYITNCHKWLFAPRGCAILYVRRELQATVTTLAISHGYKTGFQGEFLWPGTYDISHYLSAPAGLAFWKLTTRGFDRCHRLAVRSGQFLTTALRGRPLTDDAEMLGFMAAVHLPHLTTETPVVRITPAEYRGAGRSPFVLEPALPESIEFPPTPATDATVVGPAARAVALHDTLRRKYAIECWCNVADNTVLVRISVQCFNRPEEYVALARAVAEIQDGDGAAIDEAVVAAYLRDARSIEEETGWNSSSSTDGADAVTKALAAL